MTFDKNKRRLRIRRRIRKTISGTPDKPRMSVFRSNKQIFVQLIDDVTGKTILASSSLEKGFTDTKSKKIEQATKVGANIAEKAIKKGIKEVAFDRGGYLYHGRVKALAEAAREKGLKF